MDDSRKNGNATSSSQKGNDYNHNISFPQHPNFRKPTKPKRWSSITNTTLVDWIKLLSTAMGAGLITLWINESQSSLEAKRYHQRLVREYIDSVKVLLLDEYHHEEYKKPEILPTDVEDFVKSKTATTIKALKDSPEQRERLINFLRRVGVGFAPLNRDFQELPQDICDRPVTTTKNKEYSHFLCQINLDEADLRKDKLFTAILQDAKLDNAKLRETVLDNSLLQHAFLQKAQMQQASLLRANLTGAKLRDADLTGADLSGAILTGAKLRDADLSGADLSGAILTDADLTGADLTKALLSFDEKKEEKKEEKQDKQGDEQGFAVHSADLRGAILTDADLTGADLTKADLRGAKLENTRISHQTKLKDALFGSSNGRSTQLKVIKRVHKRVPKDRAIDIDEETAINQYKMLRIAPNADLSDADLSGADLTGADLTKADLRGADLRYANFIGANLVGAKVDDKTKLKDALFDSSTQLPFDQEKAEDYKMWLIAPNANLRNATLKYASLIGVDLKGADLTKADLTGADLTGADLTEADLRGAKLYSIGFDRKTKLKDALFDSSTQLPFDQDRAQRKYGMLKIAPDAYLRGANLTDADLTGADLTKADLRGADLKDADLKDADLTKADLRGADLAGAPVDDKTKLNEALFDSSTQLPFDQDRAQRKYGMLKIAPDANLTDADLTDADLKLANLTDADLTDADLTDADLKLANLTDADLTGADLTGADLTDANFTKATITNAQLASAKLCRTIDHNGNVLAESCSETSESTFPPR